MLKDLVITGATVWPEPDADLISNCAIVIRDGVIQSVSRREVAEGTHGIPVWDAEGRVVTAGFWNCHVHVTEKVWAGTRRAPATRLQSAVNDMLVSRGFTTVVDLGSNPRETLPLIARIQSGELTGPTILTATEAIYPARGLPFYVKASVPWIYWWAIPTPWSRLGARRAASRQIRKGARVIKLFTGSHVDPDRIKTMDVRLARAAVQVAHEHGRLVFAHTSNAMGLRVALDARVDVIAHATDQTDETSLMLQQAAERGVRLVPTLQMFAETVTTSPDYLDPIYAALRHFIQAGGRILFGTDVGYMSEYDTTGELAALARCGLDSLAILRALTTEPATALGRGDLGTIAPGATADLTALATRGPEVAPEDFGHVSAVIKGGRLIYQAP